MERPQITLTAVRDIPEVHPGDDLVQIILDGLARESLTLEDGDVVVVTQKIVSKAEGCLVDLSAPSSWPQLWARTRVWWRSSSASRAV